VVVERLLARPITRQKQLAPAHVVQGKSKHPIKSFQKVGAVLLIGMHQDLGIAPGGEVVASGPQLVGELEIVVNLTVEAYGDCAVLVEYGLISARHIDDAEAAHAH
jgi:hypothetical protein